MKYNVLKTSPESNENDNQKLNHNISFGKGSIWRSIIRKELFP